MREPQGPLDAISSSESDTSLPITVDAEAAGAVPGSESPPENSRVLELRLTEEGRWQELVELLLARAEEADGPERSRVLRQIASIYETQLGDPDSAFLTLEAAQADDPANEALFDDLLRVAAATGRKAELEAACRRALEASARHEGAYGVLEDLARGAERWDELEQLLARHVELAVERTRPAVAADLLAERAAILEQRGDRERARQAWEGALHLAPNHRQAVSALERIYAGTDDVQAYLEILERRVELVDSDAEFIALQRKMAELWEARLGKPLRACQALEKILLVQPSDARVQRELERLYRQEQQWQDLAQLYRRQISAAGDRDEQAELTYRMGEAWERSGDLEEATRAYREALAMVPDHADALAAVARLSELAGDLEDAYDAMLKRLPAVTDAAERAALLHRMGVIALEHLLEPAAAEQHWSSAIALEPKRLETLRALVRLYRERGHAITDAARAFDLYAQVLDLDPGNVPAAEGLVEAAFALEEWGSVVRFAEMLLKPPQRGEKRPARSEAEAARLHLTLAKAAQHLGDVAKATQYYRRAAHLDAGLQPELRAWADTLFEKQEWGGAAALYDILDRQRGEAAPPAERVELAFRLGRARLELGERRVAAEALQAAVELDGRHKPALEALARVRQELCDHRGTVAAKTALLELVDSADERFSLLCEIGALLRDKLLDRKGALGFFLRALEDRPDDQHLLHLVLELHTADKRWAEAVPILRRLAAGERDPKVRAQTLVAAGKICQYELDRAQEAVDLYEDALALDPGDAKTFSRIEKILTEQKSWRKLEAAHRRMIERAGEPTSADGRAALADLWRALGGLYRSHLDDATQASAAFETAAALEREPIVAHQAAVVASRDVAPIARAPEPAPLRLPFEAAPMPALRKQRPRWVSVALAGLGVMVVAQAGVIAFVLSQRGDAPIAAVTAPAAPAPSAPAGPPVPRPAAAPVLPRASVERPAKPAGIRRDGSRSTSRASARATRRARAAAKSPRSPARGAAKPRPKADAIDDLLNSLK